MNRVLFTRVLELEKILKDNEKQTDKDLKFSKEVLSITKDTLNLNKTLLAMFKVNEKSIETKGFVLF